jgi:hypothetical protein
MLEYTVSYSKLTYHRTTIKATSKENFLGLVAKLIHSQEISQPTEVFNLDDQELEVQTEDVNISDVSFDDEE